MKFGILTFHRAHNYGAMLQAMALRAKLAENGNEAYIIDYWPKAHREEYLLFNRNVFRKLGLPYKLNYIRKFIRDYKPKRKRINIFEDFYDQYLQPSTVDGKSECFDAIFYGSDQIWRKKDSTGYDSVFFADNDYQANAHVAYAASMGIIHDAPEDLDFLKKSMQRFDRIGIRENDLQALLEKAGISKSKLCIDPTFLLSKEKWINLLDLDTKRDEPYIIFYDLMNDSFDLDAVKRFAHSKNLPLKVLKGKIDNKNYGVPTISLAGPKEFVELIANAEYVFTSSFHGLAFSLIFEKQFFACYKHNSGRAGTILDALNLSSRLLQPKTPSIPELEEIDYSTIGPMLDRLREDSENFIKDSIEVAMRKSHSEK